MDQETYVNNYRRLRHLGNEVLMPSAFYSKIFEPEFFMLPHFHEYIEIMYCAAGRFRFEVLENAPDGTQAFHGYLCSPGQFVLCDAGIPHVITIHERDTRILNVEFKPMPPSQYNPFQINGIVSIDLAGMFRTFAGLRMFAASEKGFVVATDSENLENVLTKYLETLSADYDNLEKECAAKAQFLLLFAEINKCLKPNPNNTGVTYIKRAIEFIKNNLLSDLRADNIARNVGTHKAHLQRLFKLHTGRSLLSTINELRVDKCRKLLAESSLPLDEIASNCGFGNRQHLFYEFKKLTGVTPSEYRREFADKYLSFVPEVYDSVMIKYEDPVDEH